MPVTVTVTHTGITGNGTVPIVRFCFYPDRFIHITFVLCFHLNNNRFIIIIIIIPVMIASIRSFYAIIVVLGLNMALNLAFPIFYVVQNYNFQI